MPLLTDPLERPLGTKTAKIDSPVSSLPLSFSALPTVGRPALSWKQCAMPWALIDVALWILSFVACLGFVNIARSGSSFPNISVILIPFSVSLAAAWLIGAYDRDTDFASLRFSAESLLAGLAATILGAAGVVLFGSYGLSGQPSRFLLLAAPLIFAGLSVVTRRTFAGRTHGRSHLKLILLGDPEAEIRLCHGLGLRGRSFDLMRIDPHGLPPDSLQGRLDALVWSGQASPEIAPKLILSPGAEAVVGGAILAHLHVTGLTVYTWQSFWSQRLRMLDLGCDPTQWLLSQEFRHVETSAFSQIKRLMDIGLAGTALIVTAPLCALVWIAIRLDSPGPAVFRQQRIGLRGREFTIFKFRTMALNAEKAGATTTVGDARITRLGHLLRRSRIDEIPQLINIVRGDMSLVGPRPEWTVCVNNYQDVLPGYHLRHLAKPGLTGWAQVNYPYGEGVEDAAHKLAFDLHYVTHASLVLDCSIFLKTLYVVLGRIGGR
jgi:lipopolysaccharide/colanic/teichoic acid biosynthesis glycosyltransferase